jgi:hypothetical protein
MARVVLVYNTQRIRIATPVEMARIQQLEIARVLAKRGHDVDIATAELSLQFRRQPIAMGERLRRVFLPRVRWNEYDVIETNCHQGWETLVRYGGSDHPFVIAKIDSVVGPHDMAGVYFTGRDRERMYATQRAVHDAARYVALRTRPAQELWTQSFGPRDGHLLIPGAAASEIPPRGPDPFPARDGIRVLFSGNIWAPRPAVLSEKLNTIGRLLAPHGRLFFVGTGNTKWLDPRYVTNLGVASYEASWQHMLHADVGIVVAAGEFMHNNEATKTYYYLRAGLPTVSEIGFPNDDVVRESGLGFLVPSGDMQTMVAKIVEAADAKWDREAAVRYILEHHTWEARVKTYHDVIEGHYSALSVTR